MAVLRHPSTLLVALLGLTLGLLGAVQPVDSIVPWVIQIVDGVAWSDVWRPIHNPEPMDTYAYRPLSVVMLKLGLVLTGRNIWAMTLLHALTPMAFGVIAIGFLRRHGFEQRFAALGAASAIVMPSMLFSAWICVEFDLVGALFVMLAASALRDFEDASGAQKTALLRKFWMWAFIAMTVKETSALQLFAYLAAFAWMRRTDRTWWKLTAWYLLGLLVCTAPMHFVSGGSDHAFTLWSDNFHPIRLAGILLHTSAQLLFLVSGAGVVLLLAVRTGPRLLALLTAALFAAPIVRWYSHFEAVIFSSGLWTAAGVLGLAVAIAGLIRGPGSRPERTLALCVGLTVLGYAAAPVLLRFARADVSARIFAMCAPFLHAVIWRSVASHFSRGRVATAVAATAFAGFVLASGVNSVWFHRTRLMVEDEAKQVMADDLRMGCPALVATNPVQQLTVEELRDRGGKLDTCAWVETTTANPPAGQSFDEAVANGLITLDKGQDAYLFIQTARSQMDAETNRILAGDFGWAQAWLPESDDDLFAAF
ncbi:MAG: hypothetical protein ACI9WU_002521, partial [Myxococcota bacterium]